MGRGISRGINRIGRNVFGVGGKNKPPVPITQAPNSISQSLPAINFAEIYNQLSGDKMRFIRDANNGKVSLQVGNEKNRVALDAPIDTGTFNASLPEVRQVRGRDITQEAGAVIALSQALQQLTSSIQTMERTNPTLIAENQGLLDSFRTAQQNALNKGFDIKQNSIDTKLAKLGLSNSSTALGAAIGLAREKAEASAKANLDYYGLAQGLKQDLLGNMFKRGDQISQNANLELNRFGVETGNQLQQRGQDMQADVATQGLEQQRATTLGQWELQRNEQQINAEIARRNLQFQQQNQMATLGLDLINNGNNQAIAARQTDNQAIANLNQARNASFAQQSNPWRTALNVGVGSFMGIAGGNLANKFIEPPKGNNNNNNNLNNFNNMMPYYRQ